VTCVAGVDGMSGRLQETYETLLGALRHAPAVTDRSIRSWTLTALADMAERLGRSEWAEDHLRAALELDGEDAYVLAVYADFLLANDRAKEALVLLEGRTRTDPLLLRHALALQARGSRGAKSAIAALGARFEASRKRGDRVHLREEARYALELRHDPEAALALALENWPVQKEPADLRLLVRAARAAGDREALRMAADWMAQTGYEDAVVAPLLGAAR
jgi:Tfp pilus assembly protein PilF